MPTKIIADDNIDNVQIDEIEHLSVGGDDDDYSL